MNKITIDRTVVEQFQVTDWTDSNLVQNIMEQIAIERYNFVADYTDLYFRKGIWGRR